MKIAFVTDIHVRDEELPLHRKLLLEAALAIAKRAPDLILIGGDLAGWRVPHKASVGERNALVDFVAHLQATTDAQIVICRGNHDFPGDYDFFKGFERVRFVDKPERINLPGIDLHVWPWMERTAFPKDSDYATELHRAYSTLNWAGPIRKGIATALLGHVATANGLVREGQPVLATDEPLIDFKSVPGMGLVDVGFLGHYHLPQEVYGGRVVYGGSLFYNQFGEEGERGWTWWETGMGRPELVPLPQPKRRVLRVTASEISQAGQALKMESESGDLFKVVISVGSSDLAGAKAEAAEKLKDCRVQFDVEQTTRTREGAVDIALARTSADKLSKWLASQQLAESRLAFEMLKDIETAIETGGRTMEG